MKWFYDLNIAAKLILSFGAVLLLTLIMGVSSIRSMESVNLLNEDPATMGPYQQRMDETLAAMKADRAL